MCREYAIGVKKNAGTIGLKINTFARSSCSSYDSSQKEHRDLTEYLYFTIKILCNKIFEHANFLVHLLSVFGTQKYGH